MAEDWLADVRKYAPDADEGVVGAIVRHCGIALQSRDSSLVAMSDNQERELVRENFLKKKLGLTNSDAELDEAVIAVGQQMKEDRTKNRVTVYYLLAQHFGSMSLFGDAAGAAGAVGAAAALGAMGGGNAEPVAPLAAAAPIADPVPESASVPEPEPVAAPLAARASYDDDSAAGGGWGWLKWLLLALLAILLIFLLLRYCAPQPAATPVDAPDAGAVTADDGADKIAAGTPDTAATVPAADAAPVPAGSGVTTGERNGKPMLTVYFDTGKSAVSNDLATAAAKIKAHVAGNARAKLAVSGYNDPTGDAAANAVLSKKRAQAVGKALEAAGIPAASIELVKPAATTDTNVDKAAARRVEVTVQ